MVQSLPTNHQQYRAFELVPKSHRIDFQTPFICGFLRDLVIPVVTACGTLLWPEDCPCLRSHSRGDGAREPYIYDYLRLLRPIAAAVRYPCSAYRSCCDAFALQSVRHEMLATFLSSSLRLFYTKSKNS